MAALVFVGLGAVSTVFIVWMLKNHGGRRLFGWAMSLILSGAFRNVILDETRC